MLISAIPVKLLVQYLVISCSVNLVSSNRGPPECQCLATSVTTCRRDLRDQRAVYLDDHFNAALAGDRNYR